MQAFSLLNVGSELIADGLAERCLVVEQFHALYSINRILGDLMAVVIVHEVWDLHDAGITTS